MIRLTGHSNAVVGLAFSPIGFWLASASHDGTVREWQLPGGREIHRETTSARRATAVAIAPDAITVVAAFGDPTPHEVRWWRITDRNEIFRWGEVGQECHRLCFDPTGEFMAVGSEQSAVLGVAPNRGSASRSIFRGVLPAIDFDDQGHLYYVCSDGTVESCHMSTDTNRPVLVGLKPPRPRFFHMRFHLATRRLVFAQDDLLLVWDGPPNRTARNWPTRHRTIYSMAVGPERDQILTGGSDGLVKRWDVIDGHALDTWDFRIGEVFSLAVSSDGLTAAAGGLTDIVMWDLAG